MTNHLKSEFYTKFSGFKLLLKSLGSRQLVTILVIIFSFVSIAYSFFRFTALDTSMFNLTSDAKGRTINLSSQENKPVDIERQKDNSDFTVIILPDTQRYSEFHPEVFTKQTQWIVDNKEKLNIVFVSHVGDIVGNGDEHEVEWQRAAKSMSLLDGVLPYGFLAGNHDMQPDGTALFYNKYFPASKYEHENWWGGSFQTDATSLPAGIQQGNKNNYQFFSAGGDDYIFLHLEWCPPDEVIDWANKVLNNYSNHKVLITTHGIITHLGERDWACDYNREGANTGEDIWQKIVTNHNVRFVFGGHFGPGNINRTDIVNGRRVHQIISNYQHLVDGTNGYLRILTFKPAEDMVEVKTYSPTRDSFRTDPISQFTLDYDMNEM